MIFSRLEGSYLVSCCVSLNKSLFFLAPLAAMYANLSSVSSIQTDCRDLSQAGGKLSAFRKVYNVNKTHSHTGNSANFSSPDETLGAERGIVLRDSSGKEFVGSDSFLTRTGSPTKGILEEIFQESLISLPLLIPHPIADNSEAS